MKQGYKYVKKKDLKKPVAISMTDEEKKKLKNAAKDRSMSISAFVCYMLKGV